MAGVENLSDLQLELLEIYSRNLLGEELRYIKKVLSDCYSRRLTAEADRMRDEKGWSDRTMDKWLEELS